MRIKPRESKITLKIDPRVYPLEVIYGAAYTFVDRAYVSIGGSPKKQILVSLKGKGSLGRMELQRLGGEFQNEILSYALRRTISQNNKEIREYIISRALFSASVPAEEEFNMVKKKAKEGGKKARGSQNKKRDFIDDPLGIAVPWEEKYAQ